MARGKKLEVEPLEERIAPSSVDLGSLADGVLGNLDASGAGSGNHVASGNDPSVNGNSVNAAGGNNVSVGPIGSGIQL